MRKVKLQAFIDDVPVISVAVETEDVVLLTIAPSEKGFIADASWIENGATFTMNVNKP